MEWSVRKLLKGLNMFLGTKLTLKSDVDQQTYKHRNKHYYKPHF